MTDVRALQERLARTFRGAFYVRDLAEALLSFVTGDWDMILGLAERLEDIVLLGSTFARPRRTRPTKRA